MELTSQLKGLSPFLRLDSTTARVGPLSSCCRHGNPHSFLLCSWLSEPAWVWHPGIQTLVGRQLPAIQISLDPCRKTGGLQDKGTGSGQRGATTG